LGSAWGLFSGPAGAAQAPTPAETEGPFYPLTPQADQDFDLTQIEGHEASALGVAVTIQGRVLDTEGQAISGATVDIWQANAAGRYRHPHDSNPAPLDPHFQGWAIVQSGRDGGFKFKTIVPGPYPVSKDWTRPPHIHFKVSKGGFEEVITQMYFPDQDLNAVDRLLQSKSAAEQAMMVAKADPKATDQLHYDIVLKML
jgi:protocatechuate 3,4-dioxygenase beta subunit